MAAGAALPGLFFVFAATVMLVIVSVSAPTWNAVYFLRAGTGAREVHYGVFGFTGSKVNVGYNFQNQLPGDHRLAEKAILHITDALILHPIAAGLSGLALLFGICGASYHRAGTVFMAIAAALAMLASLVAWILDMVLWSIARHEFRNENISANYGNAVWITLGATVALFAGFCTSACGVFGSYRRRRAGSY